MQRLVPQGPAYLTPLKQRGAFINHCDDLEPLEGAVVAILAVDAEFPNVIHPPPQGEQVNTQVTPALEAFLLKVEGERLVAYNDRKDGTGKWTIGVGHTGPEVHEGLTITKETSRLLLAQDVAIAASAVDRLVRVPLTENQRFALISFVFNLGETRFRASTLLRLLNRGEYASVPAQLARWNKETLKNGTVRANVGLTNRRAAEITLWNTP